MLDSNEEIDDEAQSFFSDDKQHYVVWAVDDTLGYPTWVCTIHNKPYYLDCVNIRPQSS